jgi:DNA topoisomerase-1
MMTMKKQEGMLPAMKVNEKLHNNYITATERYSRPPARYTEASLVKNWKNWELVVRQLMHLLFQPLSTEIMLRKEILTVRRKIYAISLQSRKLEEVTEREYRF